MQQRKVALYLLCQRADKIKAQQITISDPTNPQNDGSTSWPNTALEGLWGRRTACESCREVLRRLWHEEESQLPLHGNTLQMLPFQRRLL